MPRYAEMIYNGFWFAPEREMLQALIDKSQEFVTGKVRVKLYKGSAHVIGRENPYSLYNQDLVTFEEGAVAYDERDAAGFIKLNALRLRLTGLRRSADLIAAKKIYHGNFLRHLGNPGNKGECGRLPRDIPI